ncbi:DUF4435 domain-containing protein [Paenibacillus sp. GSMTC-2017]|uniref:DUF4435 domain-containing protein n=1 Tax=Paenibacillus sp. GSMTC-2017 TaxID=2794350 RepID=UPI0018D90F5F|nr:DUF4435 domain-containing protein [Paenibacillus sp. GSMTC-2017]MBH5319031.1 DUF4435 domain-containing protein [Paenibacillus sp. GSMTC-2017]
MVNSESPQNRVEFMERKAKLIAGYHKFLQNYTKYKEAPICFVEGEDERYYHLRVKLLCDNLEPQFIICGNKDGVLNTFDLINSSEKYSDCKLLYFVDSDFDPRISNNLIYETPCYAVENFYTSREVVSKILKCEFKFDEDGPDFSTAMKLYSERQSEFHEAISLLNAWIACQRDIARTGIMTRLNLGGLKINNFVAIELDKVEMRYDIDLIESKFSHAYILPRDNVTTKQEEQNIANKRLIFRGKFELEFTKKFLQKVKDDITSQEPAFFSKKRSISINIQEAISQFSIYAETTNCLIEYTKQQWTSLSREAV